MRLKWIPVFLLLGGVAFGFISKMYSLKEVLDASTNVLVGKVESVDPRKRVAVATIERALKGKREFGKIRMNLGVGPASHRKYLLARLKPGRTFLIYYQRGKQNLAALVHAGDTWFQLFATDNGKGDAIWWRFSHLEIYMGRTFNGRTDDLVRLTADVISGKVKSPKPNPKVPKLNPARPVRSVKTKPAPKKPRPAAKPKPRAPKPAASKPPVRKPKPTVTDGLEALEGWQVDDSWARAAKLTITSSGTHGKVMTVTSAARADRKLALALMQHMDLSGARVLSLVIANENPEPVHLAVAFGAAPDWQMYETPASPVPAGKTGRRVTFRLDASTFKSQQSRWKHTQPLPNKGRIDKIMILVDGVPKNGVVRFDNVRLSRGGFTRRMEFAHKGGEVRGISWADVNGDETLDALVCVQRGNLLLVNDGGTFREMSRAFGLKEGSRSASWADYNGDGHPDLLTSNFRLYTNVGGKLRDDSKLISAPGGRNPEGAGWIDYNGDGRPDVLVTNGQHGIRLYENTGKGPKWFRDVSDKAGLGRKGPGVGNGDFVAFADVNLDGSADFFYNLGKGVLAVNDGKGRFARDRRSGIELHGPGAKRGVTFADYDADGDPDLFVPGPGSGRLYRNNNDGTFADVTKKAGDLAKLRGDSFGCAWGDVNVDGALDLFVCVSRGDGRLYLGDGKGGFTDVTSEVDLKGMSSCFGASFADVDGDGDLDLLANLKDRVVLAVNDMARPASHGALLVEVRASRGIAGAVVRVFDDKDRPLGLRELPGAEGCGGQPAPVAHFGLPRGRSRVSVCLSDGRVAQKKINVEGPLTRLMLVEKEFK